MNDHNEHGAPDTKSDRADKEGSPPSPTSGAPSAAKGRELDTASSGGFALAKRWAIPVITAVAAAAILLGRTREPGTSIDDPELVGPPLRGKVEKLVTSGGKLEICAPRGSACREAREGDEVPAGSQLRTARSTLAELSFNDGSRLSLDRDTTLSLATRGRGGELVRGGLVADIEHHDGWGARFEFQSGHLDVLGTKFALRSDAGAAVVHVVRGEVRLSDRAGHDAVVVAGEQGRVDPGSPPVTSPAAGLGEALGWSETVRGDADDAPEARPRALGELKAQKPGERTERSGAVLLKSHAVRVKIAGSVARTEIDEVFVNQTDEILEGIFRFPLPPDAKIERLALEVDGKLEEGAFVERERAAAIWRGAIVNAAPQLRQQIKEEIVWVPGPWRDPALLEWQRGGRFELRIYPIPRRGSRRVVLAYSQFVKPSAGVRQYSYPLGFDPSGNATPLDFSLEVQVRGHDPAFRLRTPGWDMARESADPVEHLRFHAQAFLPQGDFELDYALPNRSAEISGWTYRGPLANGEAGEPYVALALRPRLPKRVDQAGGRAIALVVDASRSVFGENYRRAVSLAARLARDLDDSDRVTVLACDSTCRTLPSGLQKPGLQTAREVRRFLEREMPEGASDVTFAVERGFAALRDSGRSPHVIYLGDGTATVGPTRPATIERAVHATSPRDGRVTSLGIGPDADSDLLLALARGGAGVALPYVPGQPLADTAMSVISALSGAALSDVRLELPEGISQVAPARLDSIVAGSEVIVTGKLLRELVRGDAILRGTVNGQKFEQRYPLELSVSDSGGNAFVPRLFAAARISDLERDGSDGAKQEAVALSIRHSVASRYTSLLVLESEAMYKAFGLEPTRKAPDYTADLQAEGSSSDGELALLENKAEEAGPVAPAERAKVQAEDSSAEGSMRPGGGLSGLGSRGRRADSADFEQAEQSRQAAAPKPVFAPAPAASNPVNEPLLQRRSPEKKRSQPFIDEDRVLEPLPSPRPEPRRMIPMRRIWERKGEIFTDRFIPRMVSADALTDARRQLAADDSRRQNLKRAFALSSAAGDLGEAARLAELWLEKEPLDPEAITALADVEARRGHREVAVRMLGSVLDVRPGDTAAHRRLARLERWAGRANLSCRHSIAIAEGRSRDLALVADAVRCARSTGMSELAEALLSAAAHADRDGIEQRLARGVVDEEALAGDLRVEASWSGPLDLDLSLLDTEGHRVSWLGAATRSVISARDATSTSREGLSLRGAAPGEYVLELTRGSGTGSARGELVVNVAGTLRRIPFTFDGERKPIALVRITMRPRLVPL